MSIALGLSLTVLPTVLLLIYFAINTHKVEKGVPKHENPPPPPLEKYTRHDTKYRGKLLTELSREELEDAVLYLLNKPEIPKFPNARK